MENLLLSLRCVTPMFLILCLGPLVRRFRIISEDSVHDLSTLSFRALLPCLLFYNVYSADLRTAAQPGLLAFLLAWTLGWFLLGCVLFTLTVRDPRRRGAFLQNVFRSNIAVIGVSLAQSMLDAQWVAAVAVSVSVLVPLYNVLAVVTLETCRGGRLDWKKIVKNILTNPLILACVLGFLCLLLDIRLPEPVEKAVSNVGSAGSVTTLVALGASFRFDGLRQNLRPVLFGTVLRLVISPLAAVTLAVLLGFRGGALGVILICTASPTATTSYPMALACDSDHELTGQLVVATSLFCSLTLFLWIFLLKQTGLL
ncbi:MAG: AEC family transporter [Lawsonibacter sp.]|nr:AEC family transporter [Lawsonibacter sp.]